LSRCAATRLIHPSDPWPLPGHPESMKLEPPLRLFSRQYLEREILRTSPYTISANFAITEF
jgi:hypothetical protein